MHSDQTVRLRAGRHSHAEDGVCVMELAALMAGEPLSDRPRCVSPALTALLRGYNDGLDFRRRQTLRRYAAACAGTAGDRATERARRRLIARELADLTDPRHGPRAMLAQLVAARRTYAAGRAMGRRVAALGGEMLHERMLTILDAAIAVGAPAPTAVPAPDVVRDPSPHPA